MCGHYGRIAFQGMINCFSMINYLYKLDILQIYLIDTITKSRKNLALNNALNL